MPSLVAISADSRSLGFRLAILPYKRLIQLSRHLHRNFLPSTLLVSPRQVLLLRRLQQNLKGKPKPDKASRPVAREGAQQALLRQLAGLVQPGCTIGTLPVLVAT